MTFVIDTPSGIEIFVLLQIKYKLKLEVEHPNGPKWRVSPAKQARTLMERDGWPCPHRAKARVFECYLLYLKDMKGIE
jgi:hypothetical protein